MDKILLNKSKSKLSSNVNNDLTIKLSTSEEYLAKDEIVGKIDEYKEYIKEKDASQTYRIVSTIRPYCTNILFNVLSEPVYKEGSSGCTYFGKNSVTCYDNIQKYQKIKFKKNSGITRESLILDTAYSDDTIGPIKYHCGYDIFNNHTLRRKEFNYIGLLSGATSAETCDFNTYKDVYRSKTGEILKDYNIDELTEGEMGLESKPLYTSDTFRNYYFVDEDSGIVLSDAVEDNLSEQDGWIGFTNNTSLAVENVKIDGTGLTINKTIGHYEPCSFVDMYPDRDLFSFLPKKNSYRNRYEYNWDYCLTYPYKNIEDNYLTSYNGEVNGLKATIITEGLSGLSIDSRIVLQTSIKNTFETNDLIRMSLIKSDGTIYEVPRSITILNVGENGYNKAYLFTISFEDIYDTLKNIVGINSLKEIRVRKISDGYICKYYLRKFRKLPNFKNTKVYQDNNITEDEIKEHLNRGFNDTLNNLAFSKTIYNDDVAQIVFNDDIVTTGIKDNLGRELSEIYLTIVKRNKGNKEWYENKNHTGDTIEYSHCFGNISAGVDIPYIKSDIERDYNIHTIHNAVQESGNYDLGLPETGMPLETGITIDNDEFYGDIVEFSPMALKETTLEDVCHRFNTMQRESNDNDFYDLYYNEIFMNVSGSQEYKTYKLNQCDSDGLWDPEGSYSYPINLQPEGYYYKPHYRIPLCEFDADVQTGTHTKIEYEYKSGSGKTFEITIEGDYYFNIMDKLIFYNIESGKTFYGKVTEVKDNSIVFLSDETIDNISNITIFKYNSLKPDGAYYLNDGTGRYLWKDKKSFGNIGVKDELYDSVFTNGAHYRHCEVNFYLRRQDPQGTYGLSFEGNESAPKAVTDVIVNGGLTKDIKKYEYIKSSEGDAC